MSASPPPATTTSRGALVAALGRAGLAALALATGELALAMTRAGSLGVDSFAWRSAPASFGVSALGALVVAVLLFALRAFASRGRHDGSDARRLAVAVFVAAAPVADLLFWRLTSGRRAQSLPAREALVALAALLVAGATSALAVQWWRRRRRASRIVRGTSACALMCAALVAGALDQRVFPRSYREFHFALAALSVLAVSVAADLAPLRARVTRFVMRAGLVAVLCGVVAVGPALWSLRLDASARYAAEQHAPWMGKAVAALRRVTPRPLPLTVPVPVRAATPGVAPTSQPVASGFLLPDPAVLLITIDALRADALAAYGGRGLTPNIDAIAREGVVFRRAYTPTPHTSHAIGSLFTGTYLRAVLALGAERAARPTLASRLHEAGVRTAAFYPPAIFFVDAEELAPLRDSGLGFAEREVGWASADERARQVEALLARTPTDAPTFVWAHLFEPHEPYEPLPAFARGDTERARYDGEVAAADAGVAALVRAFRARRPRGTVIVTADHGEEFGEHGARFHGTSLFDEQARVPLVWSTPGAVRPAVVDAPVELVDLSPTLLAAFGLSPDARMRGDDLGGLLRGDGSLGPRFAFASLGEEWMVTDGRVKAICVEHDDACRLFDLGSDPGERTDVANTRAEELAPLRAALGALLASIPQVEAMDDVRAPIARARLGDRSATSALLALLAADDASLRAEAAEALGTLRIASALPSLQRLRDADANEAVRAEAALAALLLGDASSHEPVAAFVTAARACDADAGACGRGAELARWRRAALALAARGDATGAPVLRALALDAAAPNTLRSVAIRALGALRVREAGRELASLLADVSLRTDAADALGVLGDRAAGDALVAALGLERYPAARLAELRALVRLGDRRAPALVRAALAAPEPVADGVGLLVAAGALRRAGGDGAELRRVASARRGTWRCEDPSAVRPEGGCAPVAGARLVLPIRAGDGTPGRLVVRVVVEAQADGQGAATFTIEGFGDARTLAPGAQELVFEWPFELAERAPSVGATGAVRVVAFVVVSRPTAP